jgi:hypothetical protein
VPKLEVGGCGGGEEEEERRRKVGDRENGDRRGRALIPGEIKVRFAVGWPPSGLAA